MGKVLYVDFKPKVRKLTLAEYHLRDSPLKCSGCRRWMRRTPKPGGKATAVRRDAPHASHCVDCHVEKPCYDGCSQCQGLVKDHRTATWHLAGCVLPVYHRAKCQRHLNPVK
jgi:hypothetical protein